jgi:hypothetical protein
MRIQAFINDWNSPRARQLVLARHLEESAPDRDTRIDIQLLESYDVPFSVQWDEAVSKFTGDIFVWAMADTFPFDPTSTRRMFSTMKHAYAVCDVAMYAPNVDWTSVVYNTKKLKPIMQGVFEVPATDLVFATLDRELLERLPPLGNNTHGWAYDYLMAHIATHEMGRRRAVVRDYNFLINHPQGKAYSEPEAEAQKNTWIASLSPVHQAGIRAQMRLQEETCV